MKYVGNIVKYMRMVPDKRGIVIIWLSFYKLPAQNYIALFYSLTSCSGHTY